MSVAKLKLLGFQIKFHPESLPSIATILGVNSDSVVDEVMSFGSFSSSTNQTPLAPGSAPSMLLQWVATPSSE